MLDMKRKPATFLMMLLTLFSFTASIGVTVSGASHVPPMGTGFPFDPTSLWGVYDPLVIPYSEWIGVSFTTFF